MITPKHIYDVWPDNDFLPFDPPDADEPLDDYRQRVGDEALDQDRLFFFVLLELCHPDVEDCDEAERRLSAMEEDLMAVRRMLEKIDV